MELVGEGEAVGYFGEMEKKGEREDPVVLLNQMSNNRIRLSVKMPWPAKRKRTSGYSASSRLMVSSIALAVWSEYPWNFSATIPFLLIT
jgi:hypothetical protein